MPGDMEPVPVRHLRCPRCGETHLTATEVTEALMQFTISRAGLMSRVTHSDEFGDVIRVTLGCTRCEYQWKPRGVRQITDLAAIPAPDALADGRGKS